MEKKIMPAGDAALVVEFGKEISDECNQKVMMLANQIKQKKIRGVREILPTFRSLMIFYDSQVTNYLKLKKIIERIKPDTVKESELLKKTLLVPCCYGREYGPDIKDMSKLLELSEEEIIKLHSDTVYKIYMLGFLPGFVYLGGLNPKICVPRLEMPRTLIPKGSVGIGGTQTGVYPVASPGGWRLIGSTPLDFYNPKRNVPILCNAGEQIHFIPIGKEEYELIRKDVEAGTYKPQYENS